MKKILIILLLTVTAAQLANAQKERKYIRESFKLYNDSNYVGAQEATAKALAEAPDSYEAKYNYAEALFKQEKIKEAQEQFEQLAATETDKQKLSTLYHNIGNCNYVKGDFDKSIEAYKNSLRADPSNDATRYNLVAAQKMRNQNQDQNNKQQEQQQQQQQQEEEEQQQQQQQEQQQQQQMDREQAERLLEALQNEENKDKKPIKETQPRRIEKNW